MKNLFWIALILLFLVATRPAAADESSAHFAAHFGASFALTTFSYGLFKKAFHMKSTPAFIFAASTALTIGLVYKMLEPPPALPGQVGTAMMQNAAGVAGAGLTIAAFEF